MVDQRTAGIGIEQNAPSATVSETPRSMQILSAFEGTIKRVRVPLHYQAALFAISMAMILLPAIYFAMIGCVGYGLYYHIVHNAALFQPGGPTGTRGTILVYGGGIVVGGILLAFMVKPIFARRMRVFTSIPAKEESEPLLFDFVEKICKIVGAPVPKRIEVDCQVNASAGLTGGLFGYLRGDLALTIGLPLVYALNLRQLAGVLAHELGHFSQRTAMRFDYLVKSVNNWFARVVYERDAWDESLIRWSQRFDLRIRLIFYVARGLVWCTRRILWVLMHMGAFISCLMSRQMEYDADRYEARISGSETWGQTMEAIALADLASQQTWSGLHMHWREKKLPENLPALIGESVRLIPGEVRAEIEGNLVKQKTKWFDTHPSTPSRMRNARRENTEGVFRLEAPAVSLFKNLDNLAKTISKVHYGLAIGQEANSATLVSNEVILEGSLRTKGEFDSYGRYFQGIWNPFRPLAIESPDFGVLRDFNGAAKRLPELRGLMKAVLPRIEEACKRHDDAHNTVIAVDGAKTLLKTGFKLPKGFQGLPSVRKEDLDGIRNEAGADVRRAESEMEGFAALAGERLVTALKLLHHPKMQAALGEKCRTPRDCQELLGTLSSLNHGLTAFAELYGDHQILDLLFRNLKGNEANKSLMEEIRSTMDRCRKRLDHLRGIFRDHPYPFNQLDRHLSIGQYLVGDQAILREEQVYEQGAETLNRFNMLYLRILASLAHTAENVEKVLGLAPWPEPAWDTREPDEEVSGSEDE